MSSTVITTPSWPAAADRPVVLLSAARSEAERAAIDAWMTRANGGSRPEVVALRPDELGARLRRGDDPLLAPVGVTWLPRERDGARAARLGDALLRRDPRKPGSREQERIMRAAPDRIGIVLAEPATVGDLRARFARAPGGGFEDFVRRQAILSLERAERGIIGVQYKVPRLVYEEITDSAGFRDGIARLADELDLEPEEVDRRARTALHEMVASESRTAIDLWDQFGRWLSRAHRISVDPSRLEQLHELNRRHALVFLPSHRSYLDPLVLRPVLLGHGFPPNHVMGGLNVSFWPIGPVTRRSGYVFIRRSFRKDEVYKWTLREYMAYLVRKRFNLEWYMEGGRSRTGKLRQPRYGLLTFLAEGLRNAAPELDPHLVPVSITYEQLHEVGDMAAQVRGASKRPESLSWLIGYARSQGRRLGRVHVSFGEPVSLRESLATTDNPRLGVQKTAFAVAHRINTVTPVTANALVALVLLGIEERALTVDEITAVLAPLLDYLERRRLPTVGTEPLRRAGGVRRVLRGLVESGVVTRYAGGTEPVYLVGPDQHLVAGFYANGANHFLVVRAIAEVVLQAAAEERFAEPVRDGRREALALRDLLKFEYFFADRDEFREELRAEFDLIDPAWEEKLTTPEGVAATLGTMRPLLGHRVLHAIAEAYLVFGERLAAHDPRKAVDPEELRQECLAVARQYRMQQRISSSEAISAELFDNALALARNRDLVDPGRDELAEQRASFAAELRRFARLVAQVGELARRELPDPSLVS